MSFLNIIEHLSDFLIFFIPGYVLLSVYNYLSNYQRENNTEHLLIKSIVGSYFISIICDYFFYPVNSLRKPVTTFIFALVLGVIIGLLSRLTILDRFFDLFSKTPSKDIWQDLNRKSIGHTCVIANLKLLNDSVYYRGQIKLIESFERDPLIVLTYYICYNANGKLLQDKKDQDNVIVFHFSQVEKFELTYCKEGE